MLRVFSLVTVACLAVGVLECSGQTVGMPEKFTPVRQYIEQAIRENQTPSVAVAVVQNDQVVWAEGFGQADLEAGRPATADSIYRLASISKPITATGLMLLVERGLVDLDAPANRYLPRQKLFARQGRAEEMTVRRIASHTSGLPLHYSFYYDGVPPLSHDEAIRRHGFAFTVPGTQFQYSNLGYGILDYISEQAAKSPWEDFLRQQLFEPLRMTRTAAGFHPDFPGDATKQYTHDAAGRWMPIGYYDFDHPGGSVICSTANDMARFARFHLNGGKLDGIRLLSETSIQEMQKSAATNQRDVQYGIGWALADYHGRRCVSHSGGMPGVSTMLRMYPNENAATIVLLNCDRRDVTGAVTQKLAEVLFGPAPPESNDNNPPREEASSEEQVSYAGTWEGTLAHFDGDIPVRLNVHTPRSATIKLGSRDERRLRVYSGQGDLFIAQADVKLPTLPGYHGVSTLEIRLRRDSDELRGVAATLAEGYFALSHWIHLTRTGDAPTLADRPMERPTFDLVIRGGRIVDGSGAPWYEADIAIRDGRIVSIGKFSNVSAEKVIDASGLVVAPGFIDMMGQTATPFLENPESGLNLLTQGITTINCGEGHSAAPVDDITAGQVGWKTMREYFARLDEAGMPVNIVQTVGHTQIRRLVLGDVDRRPTADELEKMQAMVHEAMQAGAIGVSTALIYPPAVYATTEEIAALARVAGQYGGKYFTHMRNEGDLLLEAIDEALEIGRQANTPVHIFHLKTAGQQNWGKMRQAIARIQASRAAGHQVAADIYPYIHNGLSLVSFIHPQHSAQGFSELRSRLRDQQWRAQIRREMEQLGGWENWYRHIGSNWNNVVIAAVNDEPYSKYNGQSLASIAQQLGRDPWDVFFELCLVGAFAMPQSMSEANKILAMQQEFISFDTDVGPDGGSRIAGHPRAYGAFPRVLAKYVRELGVLSLEQAIQRMSSIAANELMIYDRGRLAPGLAADITIFDENRIQDQATLSDPRKPSVGVEMVIVNGRVVLESGRYTGSRPGRVLRGPGWTTP